MPDLQESTLSAGDTTTESTLSTGAMISWLVPGSSELLVLLLAIAGASCLAILLLLLCCLRSRRARLKGEQEESGGEQETGGLESGVLGREGRREAIASLPSLKLEVHRPVDLVR